MPAGVFGHNARHEKVQKIIFATSLGAATTHFESAKGMAADDSARARPVDVDVASFKSGFYPLDIVWTAREKAAGQCVVGSVRDSEPLVKIPHFQNA